MSTLPLVAGLGMVVTTAWLVARKLAPPTATGLVLAAYLLGFAEIVAVTLILSVADSVLDWTVLVGLSVVLVAALPSMPFFSPSLRAYRWTPAGTPASLLRS